MAIHISAKHLQINKANNQLALIVAAAVVVTVFCLVSAKTLLGQSAYQRRVLAAKHKAADQLKDNVAAANQLVTQYKVFEAENPNVIGGQGGTDPGDGPSDGDNARIVLDALPSQYDFPALISSVQKILNQEGANVQGIGGTDAGTPATGTADSVDVQPQAMPFTADIITNYDGAKKMSLDFERSIRPIDITTLQLSGTQTALHVTVSATTYYQPAKGLGISQKEVD